MPHTFSTDLIRYNKPAKVRAFLTRLRPIDGNGALYTIFGNNGSKTISGFIIPRKKGRKTGGDLCLENEIESPVPVIIDTMELCNATNHPRSISI
jgi:hypothetical protein